MNKDWYKWITASITQHFNTALSSYTMSVSGEPPLSSEESEWIWLNVLEQNAVERNKDYWEIKVQIVMLATVTIANDLYALEKILGAISSAFSTCIEVKEYGDGDAVLGSLMRTNDEIIKTDLGKPTAQDDLKQGTISGIYEIQLNV